MGVKYKDLGESSQRSCWPPEADLSIRVDSCCWYSLFLQHLSSEEQLWGLVRNVCTQISKWCLV